MRAFFNVIRLLILLFSFFCTGLAANNFGQKKIDIYSLDVPGLHNKDGLGADDVIIKKIMADEFVITILPLPPKRALRYFNRCTTCCFSPGNNDANFYNVGDGVKETKAMAVAKIFIFSQYGSTAFKNLTELYGKVIGIRHGMPLSKNILKAIEEKRFRVRLAKDLASNFTLLKHRRVDAVLGWFPDSALYFESSDTKPYPFVNDFPVVIHNDALVCKGLTERFYQLFNQGVEELRKSGELEKLLVTVMSDLKLLFQNNRDFV